MNPREKQLMRDVPLMQCGNRLEFQQRLQWLSEGMLRNHLEGGVRSGPDQAEIALYQRYKADREELKMKTNIEFLTDVMEYAPTGAMMQAFMIEGLRIYSEQCVAAPEGHFDSTFMTDAIWRDSAKYYLEKLEMRRGR